MSLKPRTAVERQFQFVADVLLIVAVVGMGLCLAVSVCEVEPPSLSFTTDLPETSMK